MYNDGDRYRIQDKGSPCCYDATFSVVNVVTATGIIKSSCWAIVENGERFYREINEVDVLHAL